MQFPTTETRLVTVENNMVFEKDLIKGLYLPLNKDTEQILRIKRLQSLTQMLQRHKLELISHFEPNVRFKHEDLRQVYAIVEQIEHKLADECKQIMSECEPYRFFDSNYYFLEQTMDAHNRRMLLPEDKRCTVPGSSSKLVDEVLKVVNRL
jgi:NADH pyrophosphatase NudC (nudix superfamily)